MDKSTSFHGCFSPKKLNELVDAHDSSSMKHLLITTIAAVVSVGCARKSNENSQVSIEDAVRSANLDAVEKAISGGVDVNTKYYEGWTGLHWAAYLGDKEISELLIEKKADVNAKCNDGRTPLDRAKGKELKELLIQNGGVEGEKQKTPTSYFITNDPNLKSFYVQMAVEAGSIEAVKHYLSEGMNINIRMANLAAGDTLLHEAVYHGSMEIVELLVSKGANLNLGSGGGARDIGNIQMQLATDGSPLLPTPLDYAVRHNRTDIADLLRKHGGKTGEELKAEGE